MELSAGRISVGEKANPQPATRAAHGGGRTTNISRTQSQRTGYKELEEEQEESSTTLATTALHTRSILSNKQPHLLSLLFLYTMMLRSKALSTKPKVAARDGDASRAGRKDSKKAPATAPVPAPVPRSDVRAGTQKDIMMPAKHVLTRCATDRSGNGVDAPRARGQQAQLSRRGE